MTQTQRPADPIHDEPKPRCRRLARGLARGITAAAALLPVAIGPSRLPAQYNINPGPGCVATVENRSTQVDAVGSYTLPNVPANVGQYRVRVLCPQPNGSIVGSDSPFTVLVGNGANDIPQLPVGPLQPQPSSLRVNVLSGSLSAVGATAQLEVQAITPDGGPSDVTPGTAGTTYSSSNPAVATVDANGIVTATGSGNVVITARNDGLAATLMLPSFGQLDSDGDGMPDAYEIANGLNPYDPTDAALDPDKDGLTNLQEYRLGTNPRVADTDGDGLNDGDEVKLGTNPLIADTDGDGLNDGDEVRLGTNPLLADTDGDGISDGVEVKLGLNPLVPDATTTIRGHVSDGGGKPVSGASVTLLTYLNGTTDSTGAFTILYVPAGLGPLTATARAVISSTVYSGSSQATAPVSGGSTDVGTITLGQSSGQISGQVVDPNNKAVAGAQVTVTNGTDTRVTITDGTGLYSVSGLQAGAIMAAAIDPLTSLRGQASGMLIGGAPVTLNIKLAGYGIVSGTVRNSAGQPVGAGATVAVRGALNTSTTTDNLGHYSFPFVPLGPVTLDATDSTGNHGQTSAVITATNQTISLDVQYLARGTVSGTVSNGTSAVAGATVMLSNNGLVGQSLNTITNSLGQYSFTNVYAGTVNLSAFLASTHTGGSATAVVTAEGQTVTANIALQPTGSLSGTVYRADGTTAVAGAVVSIRGTALTTTADTNGKYTLDNIPVAGYQVSAVDNATNDRSYTPVTLTTAGATVPLDLKLTGLGTVNVTVTDGSGNTLIPNAALTVDTANAANATQQGVTAANGTASLTGVLAGTVTVNAQDPVTGLRGSNQVTLAPGGTAAITVQLQSSGTIQGTVYQSDTTTPVSGAYVRLDDRGQKAVTAADGSYQLTIVPAGQHTLAVLDAQNNVLASNNAVTITAQGQVVTANFVIVARGTVTGHVLNTDGTAAPGIGVQITSAHPGDGNPIGTRSDASGAYTVPNVPLGNYIVVAQLHTPATNSFGTANGTIPSNGATVKTDVQISTSLVPSTFTLYDANQEPYTIRENGALIDGAFSVFAGDGGDHEGGSVLSVVQNGNETVFTGATGAAIDINQRQYSIQQSGLAGLVVTRRIYVPQDGYFVRYLELLVNPTASPITVGVNLRTNFRNETRVAQLASSQQSQVDPIHILQTSSGDNVLNVADPQNPDRWASFGGPQDDDPFLFFKGSGYPALYNNQAYTQYTTLPAIGEVFDGPGGALQPTSAGFSQDAFGNYSTLTQSYNSVTVPGGGTVGLMHFVSQQSRYASANASAARLVQLPPEALYGLTTPDLQTIANFAVPAGGVSTLAALPVTTSGAAGYVYAADTTTPIAGAGVSFVSSDPLYPRVLSTGTGSDGGFSFQGALGGYAITAENYTVTATHPLTGVLSPPVAGAFNQSSTVSQTSIVFSNTGSITGTVSRGPTVLNVAGTVTLLGGNLGTYGVTVPVRADGTYLFTGVLPATYTLTARVTNTLLTGTTTAVVNVSKTTTADITIGTAGSIMGTVTRPDGSPAVQDTVYLRLPNGNSLASQVDSAGHYAFTDLPTGTYTEDVYDAQSNSAVTVSVSVTSGSTTTQDLKLKTAGTVIGKVSTNDGSSVGGLTINLTSSTNSGTQSLATTTGTDGSYTFTGVQPGSITLRTTTPAGLQGTATGSLPLAGQTVTINISLVIAGTVRGTVLHSDGTTPDAGASVTISPAPLTGNATVTADGNGVYSFANVPVGRFSLIATDTTNGDHGSASDSIQANGQVRTVNITLIGFGNLIVKVADANGKAVAQAAVTVSDSGKQYTGATDSTGTANFTNIQAGYVDVNARDASSGLSNSTSANVVASSTVTANITLQAVGTIQGTVFAVDGTTPVAGATLQLNTPYGPTTTSGTDGTYKFSSVSVGGSYAVQARDAKGQPRANSDRQTLATNGQVLTFNLTYAGVGSVTGTVTNVDGTRAENVQLQVVSKNSSIGTTQTVQTGGDGTYSVPEIPVGNFTVTVQGLPSNLSGYATGTIAADGSKVVVNIQIASSSITLPVTLTDGDGYPYNVLTDGQYGPTGNAAVDPSAAPLNYAQQLLLIVNGNQSSFADGSSPTTSIQTLSGQGVEIAQQNLQGIDVTRKIYVPSSGYFSRRLEVLKNSTSAPITVTVKSYGRERQSRFLPQIITTSNGKTTVDATTLWAVDDDDTGGLPFPRSEVALGKVFAGANAPTTLASINVTPYSYYDNYNKLSFTYQYWTYTYTPITIQANSSASILSFTMQEATAATATTASQRLVQLPAEALAGLSSDELASIVNFVVPSSPLAALPAPSTGGALSGHVYAGDGATPIPNALVYAQSTDLQYGSASTTTADATGAYSFTSLPGVNYAVEAVDPSTNSTSSTVTDTYPANPPAAVTKDISFTNTGILLGSIKHTGNTAYSAASVFVSAGNCSTNDSTKCMTSTHTVAADGTFSFLTVYAGQIGVQAYITTPQGGAYSLPSGGSFIAQVPAKQTTRFDFTLPATGTIGGTLSMADGTPAAGVSVYVSPAKNGTYETIKTDANGAFLFQSILLDSYTVVATDPTTSLTVSKTVTISQDTTSTVNLQFGGKGTIVATVHYANGNVGAGVSLYLKSTPSTSVIVSGQAATTGKAAPNLISNGGYNYVGQTDSNGQLTISNVATGTFVLRASYPGYGFNSSTGGTLSSNGQTVNVAVVLPPVGTVSGNLTNADGTIVTGAYVIAAETQGEFSGSAQTDSAGNYSIYPVPADRAVNLSANLPNNTTGRNIVARANNQKIAGDGQTLTVNLRFPGLASVQVTVQKADGTAITTGTVYLTTPDKSQNNQSASLDSTGKVLFTNVVEGSYTAYAQQSSSFALGSTAFTVAASQDNTTVPVTITASPSGTVQGKVFAGDGATPLLISSLTVKLVDNTTSLGTYYYGSNADIQFLFSGVQVGASGYTLSAYSNDYNSDLGPPVPVTATGNITSEGQVITQNLTLPISSINGTVYLYDGVTPAQNVTVYGKQVTSSGTKYHYGSTDTNGHYQVNGFLTGTVTVTAQTATGVEGTGTVTLGSDTAVVSGININLEATGTVTGTIYDSNNLPLPNQFYVVASSANNGSFQIYGTTDGSGSYVQTGVPTGTITVTTTINNVNVSNSGALSNNGDTLTLNVGTPNTTTGHIFGTVFDANGNPSSGANVTITPADTTVSPVSTTTNQNGVYGADGLPLGNVTVSATLSNGTNAGSTTGNIPDTQNAVEIDVGLTTTGQVSGKVVDGNGNAIGNVQINVSTTGDTSTSYSENTGADGSFFFSGIAPGHVTLSVQTGKYQGSKTVTLPYGGNVTATLTVAVTSASAFPPAHLPVPGRNIARPVSVQKAGSARTAHNDTVTLAGPLYPAPLPPIAGLVPPPTSAVMAVGMGGL